MPPWQDDASIADDEFLWRRVLVDNSAHVEKDPVTGEPRPTSGAFRSSREITSVAIASLTTQERFLAQHSRHSAVKVTARAVRAAGCIIVRDRSPSEDESHAHIIGSRTDGTLTGGEAKRIAKNADWLVYRPLDSQPEQTRLR